MGDDLRLQLGKPVCGNEHQLESHTTVRKPRIPAGLFTGELRGRLGTAALGLASASLYDLALLVTVSATAAPAPG